jgi:hypothetical protein
MADLKISAMTSATTPLTGAEQIPVVQGGANRKVTVANIIAIGGTVTTASVVSANGFAGTVATATTTPAITLSTTITGIIKGNGTALSAAVVGSDYAPATTGTSILYGDGAGGFSSVTVGSGLSFTTGTLASTSSGGSVTTVSVASANGLAGTVATATSTPVITLSTSITGLLKGNGTAISAATAGTDYQAPITLTTTGTSGAATFAGNVLNIPQYSGGGGSGTVTSVGLSMPAVFTVNDSPVTTSGILAVTYSGSALPVANGGTGVTSSTGTNKVVLSTAPTFDTYTNFTSVAAPTFTEGRVWYDTAQKSLAFYNDSALSPVFIGENIVLKVYNNTGSTIAKGSAVYIQSGGAFTYPDVGLAKADAIGTSAVIGLMNAATPTGNFGYVTSTGVITGVNTGAMTEGTILYLSPYSAGQLMNTVPPTGYVVQVGVVAHSNSSTGTIYTKQTTPLAISASTIVGTLAVSAGGTGITSFGTGVATGLGINIGSSGAFVTNGGSLGTPSSGTLTNATGLPISTGVSGLGTGVATALAINTGSAGSVILNGGALGTPSSLTLTNATGLPISTGVTGLGTGVATALAVNTGSAGAVVVNGGALGTPSSGVVSNMTVDGTDAIGFRNVPIASKSANYTTVLADSGKAIFHPSTDANARTFTIDSNANVAYPLGTALTFINQTSQVVSIAITTDTMTLSNTTTTGTRSLAQNGIATAIKVATTSWIISGNGLT